MRTRTGAGLATQASGSQRPSLTCNPAIREVPPHVLEMQSKNKAAVESCSYSNVAALRTPSPMRSKETMDPLARHDNEPKPGHTVKEQLAVQKYNKRDIEKSALSDSSESPEDQENLGWTTVNRRHVSSLSSLHRTKKKTIKMYQ